MYKPYDKTLDNITYIVCLAAIATGIAAIIAIQLGGFDYNNLKSTCLLNDLTGYYCPGCGGTRSLYYFLTGHILKSLYYHPIIIYTIIPGIWFTITQTIYRVRKHINHGSTHKGNAILRVASVRMWYIISAIALLLLQCAVKNILHFANGFSL